MVRLALTIILGLLVIAVVGWIAQTLCAEMGWPGIVWKVIVGLLILLLISYIWRGERASPLP